MAIKTYAAIVAGTGHEGRAPRIRAFCRQGASVRLKREPMNQHDRNAIAVYARLHLLWGLWRPWHHIGYIKADRAASWAPKMDSGELTFVSAVVDSLYAPVGQDHPRVSLRVTFHMVLTASGSL
nr:HIRAN domain-containing protein [Variovorax boronicumulans]